MTTTDVDGCPLDFPIPRRQPLDPPEIYQQLRTECPVARVRLYDGTEPWLVTRYDDVRTVLSDPRFSAEGTWRFQPSASRAAAERGEKSFTAMDPPRHSDYRRLLTRHFAYRRIAARRPEVEQVVDAVLDDLLASSPPADLVTRFGLPVASRTMAGFLGVPYEDHERYEQLANVRSVMGADPALADQATDLLLDYVDDLIGRRLEQPDDGLISELVHTLVVPGTITREELVPIVRLLLTAGHETTATMLSTGMYVLLQHPRQLTELRAEPELLPGAIEELLRYVSMLHTTIVRRAKEPVLLGGSEVAAQDGLIATPAAANKDPQVFPDPDTFDLRRDARQHLAFGFGPHQCLGQSLARLELTVAFERLFARLPDLTLAVPAADVEFVDSNLIGVARLPVTW